MNKIIYKLVLFIMLLAVNLSLITSAYSEKQGENKAADFTLEKIDGEKVVLSELLKDKKVVLVFWVTCCPVCRK